VDAFARLQPHLGPGERLLWWGGPDPRVWFTRADLLHIPFTLIWWGFFVFSEVLAIRNGDPADNPLLLALLLLGLYLVFGRFFYKRLRKARTACGITLLAPIFP
jgi:hypothetical protein